MLMGPDHLVGDRYEVFFKTEEGKVTAWLRNKFDAETGYFDIDTSRKLQLAHAREMSICAVLSYVAYSDEPDPGLYWGQMAVFCYAPNYADEFDSFINRIASKIAEGVRPSIDLGSQSIAKVLEDSEWLPTETMPLPQKEVGMAVLKDHRTMSEKMIEQGRAGNKGCYTVSIVFLVIVALAIIYGLYIWLS